MDVFSQPVGYAINFLGGQQKRDDSIKYRRLKYLVDVDLEDNRKAIYNLLTSCGVVLNQDELKQIEDFKKDSICVNYLIENYFFVPEDYDEKAEVDKYREESVIKKKTFLVTPTEFTILPTTDCNARCFYCFERGKKITVMTMDMANKVADYIIDCWNKTKETIVLRWFGGEPLYNMKAIDVICKRLTENGVDFKSSIISNGYLFSEDVAIKAVNDWKMTHAQITLDGTKDVYNKTKSYIYDDENPFEVIMRNMESMLKAGFGISIRMNVGTHNGDDLKELVSYLNERFKNDMNRKFSVYAHPIFETGMDDETKRTPEERALVYQKLEELEQHMKSIGISLGIGRLGGLRTRHCMVDGGKAILILPDGKLGLCEHYTDSEYFGQLGDDRESWDWEEIKSLVEQTDMLPECGDCVLYPTCYRLKKCLDEIFCDKYVVDWTMRRTIENIKAKINSFYKNANNNCSCGNSQTPRYDLYAGKIEFNNLISFVMLQEAKIKRISEKLGIDFSDLDTEYNEKQKNVPKQGTQSQE